jgi:hypothetical protein
MEDCVKKVGFDSDLVKLELKKYMDVDTQIEYLIDFEAEAWKVADEVGSVYLLLEKHIEKHFDSKNFDKPNKSKMLDRRVFNFIDRRTKKFNNEKTKKILYCIRDLTLNQSFLRADEEFQHWMNEIGDFAQYISSEIEKRQAIVPFRIERRIKKFYWMGDEKVLIDMFDQFRSKEFWEYDGETKDAIALHFSIDKRDTIPILSNLPFQKINWLFELNDLARWYKVMIEKNYINAPTTLHMTLASHFFLNGKAVDYLIYGDRYQHVKPKGDYKTRQPLNKYL